MRNPFGAGRRRTTIALATAAVAVGGGASALAQSSSPAPAPATPAPAAVHHPFAGGSVLGPGLFAAIFDVFGAVQRAVPGIATPIIAGGVNDGTITQAQADELNGVFSGHFGSLSSGQAKVVSKVFHAVLTELPAIAQPALDADVKAGTVTQPQATLIASVLRAVSTFDIGKLGLGTHAATAGSAAGPLGMLQAAIGAGVARAATAKPHHAKARRR